MIHPVIVRGSPLIYNIETVLTHCRKGTLVAASIVGEVLFLFSSPLLRAAEPAFEVASVKPSLPYTDERSRSGQLAPTVKVDKAFVTIRNLPLSGIITHAWRLRLRQLSCPDWMSKENFDIAAKMPENANVDAVPQMLQNLLAERFHLRTHEVSEMTPVYAVIVADSGLKFKPKPATDDPSSSGKLVPMTMEAFATFISLLVDRSVVDGTGLTGQYLVPQFDILNAFVQRSLTRNAARPEEFAIPAAGLDDSVDVLSELRQYGLRSKPAKVPLRRLIVDYADKVPTEN